MKKSEKARIAAEESKVKAEESVKQAESKLAEAMAFLDRAKASGGVAKGFVDVFSPFISFSSFTTTTTKTTEMCGGCKGKSLRRRNICQHRNRSDVFDGVCFSMKFVISSFSLIIFTLHFFF